MGSITCCHYCQQPKRHLGCHDTCPEYATDRAKLEAEKAAKHKEMDVLNYNYNRNMDAKFRYFRNKRHIRDMSGRE